MSVGPLTLFLFGTDGRNILSHFPEGSFLVRIGQSLVWRTGAAGLAGCAPLAACEPTFLSSALPQVTWHMFHSRKRAIIMPDIVKQISLMADCAPCESKHIYPTAVLLDLCSTAFHCDHSLVDAHLRPVVSAFCARAKVSFLSFFIALFLSHFVWLSSCLSFMVCNVVLSLPDSSAGFKSVVGRAAGKNLDFIHPGKQHS